MINTFNNESNLITMDRMIENNITVDGIITSPFYNTNTKQGKGTTLENSNITTGYSYVRYDKHIDNLTDGEYIDYTLSLFDMFEKVLKVDGSILYNLSYSSTNTTLMTLVVSEIINKTNFTLADIIVWKKSTAMPNSCSPNKLTRIVEFIYVFVRKDELKSFKTNKKHISTRTNGQKMYNSPYNFIEAKNNDGSNDYNKATYSTDLVNKLIDIYYKEGNTIYDPFMGTGTTALSCVINGLNYIGSEISDNQCKYSYDRLENYRETGNLTIK